MTDIKSYQSDTANGPEKVRSYILTRYKVGDKLPKVNELSKKLHTSEYAAERALTELSAEGLVERKPRIGSVLVSQNARETGTRPMTDNKTIAFIADELESFLASEILRGVDAHCRKNKISLNLMNSNYSSKTEKELINQLTNSQCAGAVVRVGEHIENLKVLDETVPEDFPVILVDRSDEDLRFTCVELDHERAAYECTQHLIGQGHQRIAHITYDSSVRPLLKEMAKRKEGYQKALREAGLETPREYIQGGPLFQAGERPTPSYFENLGYAPMNRLLLLEERPTAAFLLHFYFVPGALKAIRDHGLRVPDDISLVCIDDEPISGHLNPPITVYAQPLREIGMLAASLLTEVAEGKKHEAQCYKLAGHLIERKSTKAVNQ